MGPAKSDGARPAGTRREQIVHAAERSSTQPVLSVAAKFGITRSFTGYAAKAPPRRTEVTRHEAIEPNLNTVISRVDQAVFGFPAEQTQRALRSSVVTRDRLACTQTFGSTLGLRLRLGDLRKVYVDFLIGDAVEQMPDQV
jgi:hypothetical protein